MTEHQRDAFEAWRTQRGVWPRLTHDEIFRAGYEAALSHAEGEVFGWFTEDHDTDKSATTYDPVVADRWRKKGWPVWPLYTHPAPQVAVPEGWSVRRGVTDVTDPAAAVEFVIETSTENGTSYITSVWLDDEDPAHRLLATMLAAPTAPAGEPECCRCQPCKRPGTGPCDMPALQPISDPDGLPSDWRGVVEGAADMLGESAKQHRGRGDNATAAMCDRFGAMLRDEILSTPAPDEREIAAKAIEDFADRTGPGRAAWFTFELRQEAARLRKLGGGHD